MKILLVDDSEENLELLKLIIKPPEYEVFTAHDVQSGFEVMQREGCQIAIIDWMMPEAPGIELVRKIRDHMSEPYVYIMIVTAKEGSEALIEGLESGADDYLNRPFLPRELYARVNIGARIVQMQKELREARNAIERVKQEWEATADGIVQLICLLDRDGRVLRANRTAENWGLAWMKDVHGQYLHDLLRSVYPDFADQFQQQWGDIQVRIADGYEYEFVADDFKFGHHFQVHLEPIERQRQYMGAADSFAAVSITDITERRNLEFALKDEHDKSERILRNILPRPIADRLKGTENVIADEVESATVLFADIVGFTNFASLVSAQRVVEVLNDLFSRFDAITDLHAVEKIKTIGDGYMAASGVPIANEKHAEAVVQVGLDMLKIVQDFNQKNNLSLGVRIGIHSGAVIAGVIGQRKYAYDLWSDTVNIANRLESTGRSDHIQISQATADQLPDCFELEKRDPVEIKGRGQMQTYFVKSGCMG